MPGTTISTVQNVGYRGSYARNEATIIAARIVNPANTAVNPAGTPAGTIAFGDAVFMDSSGAQASAGGNYSNVSDLLANGGTPTMTIGTAGGMFVGFAVREVKTNLTFSPIVGTGGSLGPLGYYLAGEWADVMERGSIVVPYGNPKSVTAPIAGGPVYLRISTNGAGTVVGVIEAASDTSHTLTLTNCAFTTGLISTDANGFQVIEVTLLSRNQP